MAVVNLCPTVVPYLSTDTDPVLGNLVFTFENMWSPEGTFRFTLWRNLRAADIAAIPELAKAVDGLTPGWYITVRCKPELLIKRGTIVEKSEHYFTQGTLDSFTWTIYDAPNTAWIDAVERPMLASGLPGGSADWLSLSGRIHDRLFTKYIKPDELAVVYGQVEFQGELETRYSIMACGQMQNAIGGEADKQWLHKQENNPFLDETTNITYDAERAWNLSFVPMSIAGLSQTPAKPTVDITDTSSWLLPTYEPGFPHASPPVAGASTSLIPWKPTAGHAEPTPGVYGDNVVPFFRNTQFGTPTTCSRWYRHINANKALGLMLDYAFGVGNWDVECKDFSPVSFTESFLPSSNDVTNLTESIGSVGEFHPIRFMTTDPKDWLLIPHAAFGVYDDLIQIPNIPLPTVESQYPKRFRSAWEIVLDWAYACGFSVIVQMDDTVSPPIAHLKFHPYGEGDSPRFTTIVPHEATPTAFAESESGIKVTREKSFADAWQPPGGNIVLFDDFFAQRSPGATTAWDQKTLSVRFVPDSYTVPSTAKSAVELKTTLVFGSALNFSPTSAAESEYYSVFPSADTETNVGAAATRAAAGANYPILTPLVLDTVDPTDHAGDYLDISRFSEDAGAMAQFFAPVISGAAQMDGGTYGTSSGIATAWRKELARFYAWYLVKAATKYVCKYQTINRFAAANADAPVQGESWKNVRPYFQCQLFEPKDELYWVKSITRDLDAMDTSVEYLQSGAPNHTFLKADGSIEWHDEILDVGPSQPPGRTGTTPVGVIAASGSPSPYHDTIVLNTSGGAFTLTMLDATTMPNVTQTFVNTGSHTVSVSYTSGQGTNFTLPAYTTFQVSSDGTAWNTVLQTPNASGARRWSSVPASSSASGTVGDEAYDSNFVYVCTATNTWKRTPIATF